MEVTGYFEVWESASLVCSGNVSVTEKETVREAETRPIFDKNKLGLLDKKEVYKECRIKGYDYNGEFQGIVSANVEGVWILTNC